MRATSSGVPTRPNGVCPAMGATPLFCTGLGKNASPVGCLVPSAAKESVVLVAPVVKFVLAFAGTVEALRPRLLAQSSLL